MKIAVVALIGGDYSHLISSALAEQGNQVLLVIPDNMYQEFQSLVSPAVEVYAYAQPRLRQIFAQIRTTTAIRQRIEQFKPDVIHVEHGQLWFYLSLPFLRRYPLVITVHDPKHHVGDGGSKRNPQAVMTWGYRQADQLIVHGEQLKQILVQSFAFAPERVTVTPLIASTTHVQPPADVETHPNSVLFYGRIWEYKGLEYLIRAEPLVTQEIPDFQVVIAGFGEEFQRYRDLMVNPDRFVVHNRYIEVDEIPRLFAATSIVVLPYIDATQSGVIPIAYAYRKPVIATPVGALAEAVDDQQTGILVPPRDVPALAQAIISLLKDPARRQAMGQAGFERLARAAPPLVAEQTLTVLRRAIAEHRR
jgi:glycosyltransferase involved in cell wall biosynthesis